MIKQCSKCERPSPRACPICQGLLRARYLAISTGAVLDMDEATCHNGACGACCECVAARAAFNGADIYETADSLGRFWICRRCDYGLTMPEAALRFAQYWHHDQTYGHDVPYIRHVVQVLNVLREFGHTDPDTMTVGALHDVVEDTDARNDLIAGTFGPHIAGDVATLTDGPGNRAERKAAMLVRLHRGTDRALIVKFADRLANVRMSSREPTGRHHTKHRAEHADFRKVARPCVGSMAVILDALLS